MTKNTSRKRPKLKQTKATSLTLRDKLLKYFLYLSFLLLGIAIGIAIRHFYNVPIIEAINIVDVATLIVTVFLAVYIPGVFDRKLQIKQEKKELIEHRIEDLQDFYRRINMLVQQVSQTPRDLSMIDNTLDVATNRLKIIRTLMDYLDFTDDLEHELNEITELNAQYRELLKASSEPQPADFSFSREIKRQDEMLYNKIDQATSLLVFKVSEVTL